jgi:hypothetical protein
MDDTKIIDWMQENYVSLCQNANDEFEMTYIGRKGENRVVRGKSLRECCRHLMGISEPLNQGGSV